MRVTLAEHLARNHQHTPLDRLLHELRGGETKPLGHLHERVERAARSRNLGHALECLDHHVTTPRIFRDGWRQVAVERGNHAPLQRGGRADEAVLLQLRHLLHQRHGPGRVAEPPTGATVGLAEAADQQALIGVSRRARAVALLARVGEAELVVDLVADEQHPATLAQIDQVAHLGARHHRSAWIARRVHQHRLGARRDQRLHALGRHAEVGIGVAQRALGADHLGDLRIHHEVRIRRDELVPRVQHGHHRQQQTTAGATGDDGAKILRGPLPADILLQMLPDGRMQFGNALGDRIAAAVLAHRVGRGLAHDFRHGKIRLPDREIDRILQVRRQVEHLADTRRVDRATARGNQPLQRHALRGIGA